MSIFLLLILLRINKFFKINNQEFFKIKNQRFFLLLLLKNQQFFKIKNQQFFLLPLFSTRMSRRRTWSFAVEGLLIGSLCHPFLQLGLLCSLLTQIRSSITWNNLPRTTSFNTWIVLRHGFQSWSLSKSPNHIKTSYLSSFKR